MKFLPTCCQRSRCSFKRRRPSSRRAASTPPASCLGKSCAWRRSNGTSQGSSAAAGNGSASGHTDGFGHGTRQASVRLSLHGLSRMHLGASAESGTRPGRRGRREAFPVSRRSRGSEPWFPPRRGIIVKTRRPPGSQDSGMRQRVSLEQGTIPSAARDWHAACLTPRRGGGAPVRGTSTYALRGVKREEKRAYDPAPGTASVGGALASTILTG
jgi:hypothetical protein